jgi:enoyl-CoA hydratase/carnithine racemase
MRRVESPPGGSTLITSAPMSHSCIAQNGPAITCVTSSTRIPSSALGPLLMPTPQVLFESTDHVAYLTFNRPEAKNAITFAMYDALVDACEKVDGDPTIRVFVLRANGDAFAAGTDIGQFTDFKTAEDGLAYERRLDAAIDRLERVNAATIAQVHGVAAGGGCAIALACDLRVCTPAAQFGMPIARTLGNCLSAANYARLIDLIGPARTKDLLFTARLLTVAEADSLGLVTRVAGLPAINDVVRDLAATIASHAPLTIRTTKEVLRRIAAARRLNAGAADDIVGACYASDDFREGVASFLAKRSPRFSGH